MSRNRNRYNKQRSTNSKPCMGDKARETLENIDEDNPVIQMFKSYALELEDKHDRYERLVKLSRDITIESKRIIFSLHNVNTDIESKKTQTLIDAKKRLQALIDNNFKSIAEELVNYDSYQYHRAYTAGMQEFIEAFLFYQYLSNNETMERFADLIKSFVYKVDDNNDETNATTINLLVPHYDFILGIADFTGELMRKCINNLGVGNTADCFKLCNFVRQIHSGFLGIICPGNKEISRKLYVLKQSLSKMELVCYNIQIRGSEIPKHMLASVLESSDVNPDDDEGYY